MCVCVWLEGVDSGLEHYGLYQLLMRGVIRTSGLGGV